MSSATDRLISAVRRPFADNPELHVMAGRELEEIVGDADDEAWEKAAARLEQTAGRSRWSKWKIALFAMTAVVSIATLGMAEKSAKLFLGFQNLTRPNSSLQPPTFQDRLSPEQRRLLYGRGLWRSSPENPAYLADHAVRLRSERKPLPADFVKIADEIDPENMWFPLFAAGVTADDVVEKVTTRGGSAPSDYKVIDQAKFDEALELIHRAAGKSRWDSYQTALAAERAVVFPEVRDFSSYVLKMSYFAGLPSDSMPLTDVVRVMETRARQLADAGDTDGFLSLNEAAERIFDAWSRADGFLVDGLILKVSLGATAKRFAESAGDLGLNEEAARWRAIDEWITADKERRNAATENEGIRLRSGIFAGMLLPAASKISASAPPITNADLRPTRLADHELFGSLFSATTWLVLGLMLAAAGFYRHRAGLLIRRLAMRFETLLRPVDWAWILGAGVVLPIAFHQAVIRFTPLGGREWSLIATDFAQPFGQFAALAALLILLPVMLAGWRLDRRTTFMKAPERKMWPGWLAVGCGAVSIPVFGLALEGPVPDEAFLNLGWGLLGVPILMSLGIGVRALSSKRSNLPRRVTLSRTLLPAYALGMLLMAAAIPAYQAAERHWFAQDRLMAITPDAPAFNRYEYEVSQAMRQEIRDVLEDSSR